MIKDKFTNIGIYSINEAFETFKKRVNNLNNLVEIELPFKAIPLEYETRNFDLSKFENHRKFIDVHYIISGREVIGLANKDEVQPNMEYDELNDYQLFNGTVKEKIILHEGEFLILFEHELHVTGGFVNQIGEKVKKIVFKVPIEQAED